MTGRGSTNLLLALAVLLVFGLNLALGPNPEARNFEVMPEMVTPVPYESFSANPVLAGGVSLQPPPGGTIPRGRMPLRFGATPEENQRAGRELANPFSTDDPAALERGGQVFQVYCRLCHGPEGRGDGPVARRGFPAPPSLLGPDALALADGQIFHLVTFGRGNMPGHAVQVEPEDRWQAVLWVRELQRKGTAAEAAAAGAPEAAPAAEGPPASPDPQSIPVAASPEPAGSPVLEGAP